MESEALAENYSLSWAFLESSSRAISDDFMSLNLWQRKSLDWIVRHHSVQWKFSLFQCQFTQNSVHYSLSNSYKVSRSGNLSWSGEAHGMCSRLPCHYWQTCDRTWPYRNISQAHGSDHFTLMQVVVSQKHLSHWCSFQYFEAIWSVVDQQTCLYEDNLTRDWLGLKL